MSMLGMQADELRRKAGRLDRASTILVDCEVLLPEGWPKNAMDESSAAMREAADTIESLRDRLQELQGVTDESRYTALFGTPERAAQLIADNCEFLSYCGQCWVQAANCDGTYSTVLEWLRGDA